MSDRCEPPEGLRDKQDLYLLRNEITNAKMVCVWAGGSWHFNGQFWDVAYLWRAGWRYICPVPTPAEIAAQVAEIERLRAANAAILERIPEAAHAMSAAWEAAPAGEGVAGAEYFAAKTAECVLREGLNAEDAFKKICGGVGTYGVPFKHILIEKEELQKQLSKIENLETALKPFVDFWRVQEKIDATTPTSGTIFGVETETGKARLTVEHFKFAAALEQKP